MARQIVRQRRRCCWYGRNALPAAAAKTASEATATLTMLLGIVFLCSPAVVDAFAYRASDQQLLAPEMLCVPGVVPQSSPSRSLDGLGGSSEGNGASPLLPPCPATADDVSTYEALVMDENGYVDVTLIDVTMRDDGRRRHGSYVGTDDAYYREEEDNVASYYGGFRFGRLSSLMSWLRRRGGRDAWSGRRGDGYRRLSSDGAEEEMEDKVREDEEGEEIERKGSDSISLSAKKKKKATREPTESSSSSSSSANQKLGVDYFDLRHHLQIYLVNLDEGYAKTVPRSRCCYELEFGPPFPSWVDTTVDERTGKERAVLPEECTIVDPTGRHPGFSKAAGKGGKGGDHGGVDEAFAFAHDYRVGAPRIGPGQKTSGPLIVNEPPADAHDGGGGKASRRQRTITARLRPTQRGRHMVVLSNCAAELTFDPRTNATSHHGLRAVVGGMELVFVSKFGELPLSLMGIIPFYGIMAAMYGLLVAAWWTRSRGAGASLVRARALSLRPSKAALRLRRGGSSASSSSSPSLNGSSLSDSPPPPLLGLQRAIYALVVGQFVFAVLAFAYYLRLNGTSVDVDTLYSGTAAALVSWGPWSMLIATAHFVTLLGCQVVVTLATDGTWLISHGIRTETRFSLYVLVGMWVGYFLMYGFLRPEQRSTILVSVGVAWVVFLLFNVRRSLRHLRSLMVGRGGDTVMVVGGALVAKRSLYRKMCAVVAIYPVVFLLSVAWNSSSRQDSWTWVGYVLGDIYLFVILLHASIMWMPRPMASHEYVKYAPLEVSVATNNDMDLWEEEIGEQWDESEADVEHKLS